MLELEALYYMTVVLLEVPSGYFSDRFGRRKTLLISALSLGTAYGFFATGTEFLSFALGQIFLAVAFSFKSGTDASFHYDSLLALGRESEYGEREGKVARVVFLSGAVAALLGGTVAVVELRYAYFLSFLAGVSCFAVALLFEEPAVHHEDDDRADGILEQIRACFGYLLQPGIRWVFIFVVLMTVINHIPYEFYQPYLDALATDSLLTTQQTPLIAGIHTAVAMYIGSIAAGKSMQLQGYLKTSGVLLLAAALQTVIIISMSLFLHPLIAVVMLLRSAPGALMRAPMNSFVAPRTERRHRATYLSFQSLAGRLAFSITLLALALLSDSTAVGASWGEISRMLSISSAIGIIGVFYLLVTAKRSFSSVTTSEQ